MSNMLKNQYCIPNTVKYKVNKFLLKHDLLPVLERSCINNIDSVKNISLSDLGMNLVDINSSISHGIYNVNN